MTDDLLMEKCINLALKGTGMVSPNPLVGCVIVKDGRMISEGYHHRYGEAHAERNAIDNAIKNKIEVAGSTLYVNLEPCSHTGNTGPCADLIAEHKIAKVKIGIKDPYEKVNGRGIQKLLDNNIEVETGILEERCTELNKFFIKYVTKSLPYVTLKAAQSIDGKIALKNFDSKWITGGEARKYVHKLRAAYDSVLIGYNTALQDDPSLNVRDIEGRNPYRLILDERLMLPEHLKVFNDEEKDKTIVFTKSKKKNPKVQTINLNENTDMSEVLKEIYKAGINSVLVEGGAGVFSAFIEQGLADELLLFIAPKIIGEGISLADLFKTDKLENAKKLQLKNVEHFGEDIMLNYKFKN